MGDRKKLRIGDEERGGVRHGRETMMERGELERIYDTHGGAAFGLFMSFSRCEADARDLLQDWLVKIGRGLDTMEGIGNERAYVLRIAYRQAVDWRRRGNARKKYHEAAGVEQERRFASEGDPDRELLRRQLEKSLIGLCEEQRLVVEMRLWDGLTYSEIGEVLGISPNTAASRYRYGTDKMREELRPYYEEIREI